MISRLDYEVMAEAALREYEQLRLTCPNAEIVFVVSEEALEAMFRYELGNDRVRRPGQEIGLYYGVPVCRIIEEHRDVYFMPVIHSRNFQHYDGVQVNDYILFNDENDERLFRLARVTPAQYVDTGLTVSFVDAAPNATATAHIDAAQVVDVTVTGVDTTVTLGDNTTLVWTGTGAEPAGITGVWDGVEVRGVADAPLVNFTNGNGITFTANATYINRELLNELAGYTTMTIPAETVLAPEVKEQELNPGDTKALDEFLGGFLRSGA